jgi:hypothetical protein
MIRPCPSRAFLAALALLVSPLSARGGDATPVLVGGESDLDACLSLGQVVGLDPAGDNFLAVRAGPGSKNAELDRLGPKRLVTVCDERGRWLSVVYAPEGSDTDCGTGSPQAERTAYRGPCRSGWVHASHVEIVAG